MTANEHAGHIEEITNYKKKCPEVKKHAHTKFVPLQDFRIKTEWISDDSGDEDISNDKPQSGELDGHFAYPKINENPAEMHSFICDHCQSVFWDRNELHNHYTNHNLEFFQCLVCDMIYHSVQAFQTHKQSHDKLHVCLVCTKRFKLKTTLMNHMQVHNEDKISCSFPGCDKSYKYRQNQLEHLQWGHWENKECPCTVCGKLFQTPTNMCTHCLRQHG